jgi:hypothetical protein
MTVIGLCHPTKELAGWNLGTMEGSTLRDSGMEITAGLNTTIAGTTTTIGITAVFGTTTTMSGMTTTIMTGDARVIEIS